MQFAMTFSCIAKEWEFLSRQKRILKELQTGHPCISRMKSLMIVYVHWHSMTRDIESLVKSCKRCALAQATKFNPRLETNHRWSRLHIGFAGQLNVSYYLIVVDSFSKWLEILRDKKPSTGVVIRILNELLAKFGGLFTQPLCSGRIWHKVNF